MQAVLMGVTAEVSCFCLLPLAGTPFQCGWCKALVVARWPVGIEEVGMASPFKAPSLMGLPASRVLPQLHHTCREFSLWVTFRTLTHQYTSTPACLGPQTAYVLYKRKLWLTLRFPAFAAFHELFGLLVRCSVEAELCYNVMLMQGHIIP